MSSELGPFQSPRAESEILDPAVAGARRWRLVFGWLLWLECMLLFLAGAAVAFVFDVGLLEDLVMASVLILCGSSGMVAGYRWIQGRPGSWWLLMPGLIHVIVVGAIVVVAFERLKKA